MSSLATVRLPGKCPNRSYVVVVVGVDVEGREMAEGLEVDGDLEVVDAGV